MKKIETWGKMKEKLVWNKFNVPIPKDISHVWVSDYENIWICTHDEFYQLYSYQQLSWAKTNFIYPDVPVKPLHECKNKSFTCSEIRQANEKKLVLEFADIEWDTDRFCEVEVCPFCGIKADEL